MPLVNCPTCGRAISTEAEACPQCGHPNRPSKRAPAGPKCYACSATATTKCQSCGTLSCVEHLESIAYGEGFALVCESCCAKAKERRAFWLVVGPFIGLVIPLIICWIALAQPSPKTPTPGPPTIYYPAPPAGNQD